MSSVFLIATAPTFISISSFIAKFFHKFFKSYSPTERTFMPVVLTMAIVNSTWPGAILDVHCTVTRITKIMKSLFTGRAGNHIELLQIPAVLSTYPIFWYSFGGLGITVNPWFCVVCLPVETRNGDPFSENMRFTPAD